VPRRREHLHARALQTRAELSTHIHIIDAGEMGSRAAAAEGTWLAQVMVAVDEEGVWGRALVFRRSSTRRRLLVFIVGRGRVLAGLL